MRSFINQLSVNTVLLIVTVLPFLSFAFSPYLDLHAKPHISVVLLTGSNPSDSVLESEVDDLLIDKNTQLMKLQNETFLCTLPKILNKTSEDAILINENNTATTEHELAVANAQTKSVQLLESLKSGCIYYMKDYWLYELCYGTHVLQYHPKAGFVIPEPGTPVFTLGVMNDTDSLTVESEDGGQYHVSQLYTNGSVCDLTSDNRTVEVQYSCDSALSTTKISSISEKKTCHYIMMVHTPLLCEESLFNKKDDFYQVTCKVVVSSFDSDVTEPVSSKTLPTGDLSLSSIGKNLVLSVADVSKLLPTQEFAEEELNSILESTTSMVVHSLEEGSLNVDGQLMGINDEFSTEIRILNDDDLPVLKFTVNYENGVLDIHTMEEEKELETKNQEQNEKKSDEVSKDFQIEKNEEKSLLHSTSILHDEL